MEPSQPLMMKREAADVVRRSRSQGPEPGAALQGEPGLGIEDAEDETRSETKLNVFFFFDERTAVRLHGHDVGGLFSSPFSK